MDSAAPIQIGSRLYLTAAPGLPAGSPLSPGGWLPRVESMVVARSNPDGGLSWDPNVAHVLLELACETVRLREFPHLPSRLDCLFLWADEAEARAWRHRKHVFQGSTAGLYEVEVTACGRAAAVDHNLVSYLAGDTAGELLEQARRYWRGERTGPAEILLEGTVRVLRDLLALSLAALEPVSDPVIERAIRAAVRWSASGEGPTRLTPVRAGLYHLRGSIVAGPVLPLPVAGWVAIAAERTAEPLPARRGSTPLRLRPGERIDVSERFDSLPPLSSGDRIRPILLCDRAAAHYWQIERYWDGRIEGDWWTVGTNDE